MGKASLPLVKRRKTPWRFIMQRPRFWIGTVIGIAAYLAWPTNAPDELRLIVSWDIGTILYLVLTGILIARTSPEILCNRAAEEDENRWVIMLIVLVAAILSISAIVGVLVNLKSLPVPIAIRNGSLAMATIILSWFLVHTMLAIHYAHYYYGDTDLQPDIYKARGGLKFPDEDEPGYSEFLYFSFVIGMTFQVSDVEVTHRTMRQVTLAHGVVSFFFNTVILALCINIAAGLL